MANITHQAHTAKSIIDIYNRNSFYVPNKNSIVLLSTQGGTAVASKLENVILSSLLFDEPLSALYCKDGLYKNVKKIKG